MEKDLISVIVPVYNVEKYLEKCLESIINQTYKNIEIILVDDGSTDKSKVICDEYKKKDERIVLIHKPNGGLSDARNEGIKLAKGKYITFVDSDDYLELEYIEYLYNLIKKCNCKISISSYYIENEKKERIDMGKNYKEKVLNTEEAISRMLCEEGFTVSACAKMYEKELFNDIKYPKNKLCEDNGTTYLLLEKCEKIAYGNLSKYIYIKRQESIMNSKFSIKKMDLIELTDEMAKHLYDKMPSIRESIIKRQMHARFSVLRQIVFSKDEEHEELAKKIRKDLLVNYKKQFFINSKLDFRDRIGFISLCFGLKIYKMNWKVYLKMKG